LGPALLIDRTIGARGIKIMAAAVGIEADRQTVAGEHFKQPPKRRGRALFLDQERRIDRARRIVHGDDQVELRLACKPERPRAILVQHHSFAGLALALAPVGAALLRPLDEACIVQLGLHKGVAPAEIVVAREVLVKMLHVPAPVDAAVEVKHPLALRHGNALGRRLAEPAVHKPLKPFLLIALAVAPELPLRYSEQLAGLRHR
jgi:hypothetical protein